jgi:alkanesulfonate monooxygenase SsuD/methylene tetrahydromethanopterin reductase-like flavin-dependent oxidoreductase (luciferase family)
MQARIDEAAKRAGREPAAVKRVANTAALEGEPDTWADQLRRAAELGFEALMVPVPDDDPVGFIRRLGEDVAPGIR